MDRSIVYTAELPRTVDFLNANKMAMMGLAYAMKGCLGWTNTTPTPPYVEGLACTPTTPTADLNVHVGIGSVYAVDPVDASAYSDLGTDATHSILKQGILNDPVSLAITPPGTPGFSQVYLVQAALQDVDTGSTVLPYYNAANPSQPYSGPGNNGTSQYTIRQVNCVVALKAGVAASTGSQVPPSPDVGYVPLYWVTVINGQSQITTANIATATTAPFFPTLPSMPVHIQNGDWISADDTGTANNMVIAPTPAIAALQKYQKFRIKVKNNNSGPTNLTVNGHTGGCYVAGGNTSNFPSGALLANTYTEFVCDGINFQLAAGAITINNNSYTTGVTSGLTNVQAFTSSGTYLPTSGATKALVFCTGAGGGGATSCNGGGGGGGGGATAIALLSLSGVSSVAVTIGAGGTGVTSGSNGGTGGDSSFGSYALAHGGQGAQYTGSTPRKGGPGGAAVTGLLLINGGDGLTGNPYSGAGGGSFWGGGTDPGYGVNTAGLADAVVYGCGGGSSNYGGTAGSGKSGLVLVLEF